MGVHFHMDWIQNSECIENLVPRKSEEIIKTPGPQEVNLVMGELPKSDDFIDFHPFYTYTLLVFQLSNFNIIIYGYVAKRGWGRK